MGQDDMEDNQSEDARKIFVGGLSWNTSQEKLHEYFSRYGEVVDSCVMVNRETGKSRGFGFVTYKDLSCVGNVLSSGPHELDGRTIDPKVCSAESQQGKKTGQNFKVFLGGLPANCTETDLRSFFSRYGTVVEVILMYDQEKKKPRGFGFLSFEKEDSVKQVCAEHFVKINGRKIECKHAESSDKRRPPSQSSNNAPAQQWSGAQMGTGNWGPGAPGANMGPGGPMNNGMMGPPGGGYQGGWGGPPAYGQGWGPQPGPYGPGNNGWGWGPGYGGPYGGPGPQYGPPAYGYGYNNYGGGYGGPMGGQPPPNPPAPGTENSNGGQAATTNNSNTNNNSSSQPGPTPPGMGNYPQEQSNFGPARPGYGPGPGPGYGGGPNYNSGGNYPAPGNYGGQGDAQGNRATGQPGQGGYHPYNRQ